MSLTVILNTTRPALGQVEYGVRRPDNSWKFHGMVADYTPADLTEEQNTTLDLAADVLAALALSDATVKGLPTTPAPVVVVSKPESYQLEYQLVDGSGHVLRHGETLTYDPQELTEAELNRVLAARALLLELATADATAKQLIP